MRKKLKPTLCFSGEAEPAGDDEDSDEEDDEMDAVDGQQTEIEPEIKDDRFLSSVMESFIKKCSVLKTRCGRAGLVHNFLRGLQLMTAPVSSGEPRLLIVCLVSVCLFTEIYIFQAQHWNSQNQLCEKQFQIFHFSTMAKKNC